MSQKKTQPTVYFDTHRRLRFQSVTGKNHVFYAGRPDRNPMTHPSDIAHLRNHPDVWEVVKMQDGTFAKRADAAAYRRKLRSANTVKSTDMPDAKKGPVTEKKPDVPGTIVPPKATVDTLDNEPELPKKPEGVDTLPPEKAEPEPEPEMESADDLPDEKTDGELSADDSNNVPDDEIPADDDPEPLDKPEPKVWTEAELKRQNKSQLEDIARIEFEGKVVFKADATKAEMIAALLTAQEQSDA